MYLIIDKKTKAILHMSNSLPGEDRKPEEIFPQFNSATMEFGRAPEQFIPVRFAVENGVVKDLDLAPVAAAAGENLAQARERILRGFTDASFSMRKQLIPDYQLLNAGIGIYDAERTQAIKDTVQAFRDEVQRVEKLAAAAKSVKELEAIKPSFPTAIAAKPKTATKSR
jgi:hypothetical protein